MSFVKKYKIGENEIEINFSFSSSGLNRDEDYLIIRYKEGLSFHKKIQVMNGGLEAALIKAEVEIQYFLSQLEKLKEYCNK